MKSRTLERTMSGASLSAAIVGAVTAFSHLAIDVKGGDLIIAMSTVFAAAIVGALSVYVARIAKALPKTQRIFISYSYEEKDRARKLRDVLQGHGAKVWFDENALQPGSDLRSSIAAAIESSNTVVALVSSRVGDHLSAELRAAMDRHVPVYAVFTGDKPPSDMISEGKNIRVLRPDDSLEQVASTVLAAR